MPKKPLPTKKKTLTVEQFDFIVPKLNISEQTICIAKGVLVEGKKQTEFCTRYNITKAAVSLAVRRVYEAYLKASLPPGYEEVKVVLPSRKAYIVKKWSEQAKDKLLGEMAE